MRTRRRRIATSPRHVARSRQQTEQSWQKEHDAAVKAGQLSLLDLCEATQGEATPTRARP